MDNEYRGSTAQIAKRPIYPVLVPVPIVCFGGTLVTDIAYFASANLMWADFSSWLLTAGLIMGILAAVAWLFDFLGNRLIHAQRPAWPQWLGILALVLSTFNALIHSRDAWTSVVPAGLSLSAIVVLIMAITGWLGRSMSYRHGAGMAPTRKATPGSPIPERF